MVRSSAVLSVGLAPGLTNLLALEAVRQMDQTDEIEIAIMLGLGDAHGKAAIEWTVDSMGARFEVKQNNHQAYRFPFSDQQTLGRALDVSSISTRFCLDSVMVTKALAFAQKSGIVRFLQLRWVKRLIVRAMEKFHFGADLFIIKVEARGRNREGLTINTDFLLQGRNQSIITAKVTAAVSKLLNVREHYSN